ncbi:50S ribosome-binding GTPase [Carex littledalei]|uniref:50S ribosome-binding GTPase n=1 Tax=Carex littledalei TaxID=544730 RepID=A0A833QZZ2_9POAL|nr:50S ribosome-binding GTPase [Carex littledalei]
MAGAFTSPSGVTPLTRSSSYKTSFNSPITLLPSFALFSARKCSSLSLSLLCKCNSTSISAPKSSRKPVISEGRDEDLTRHICPGCGVFMQDSDPNLPGYYKTPTSKDKNILADADGVLLANSDEFSEIEDELVNEFSEESDSDEEMEDLSDYVEIDLGSDWEDNGTLEKSTKETDWDKDWDELDEEGKRRRKMDGFALPGVGYGNITEEYLKKIKKEKITKSEKKRKLREEAKRAKQEAGMVTVCARCHSLRNYGQIKNPNVENLIPDFDFDRFISTRLMKPAGATSVVVMVVDCTDFDGSFPKVAAKSLFKALEGTRSKVSKLPKLILVATKVDLLPSQISPARLNKWVRGRAKANGAHKLDSVIQVSSHKDLNIRNLISCIKQSAGPRGNVWVVGAQNAGKSTLINAFAKKEGVKIARLTEAAVPGTTLGILRVTGILPAKVKMYDTPGLLHSGLMMNRLNREEQKMVEIRKELRPRSYRVKARQTVHVGGLMRLDLIQASVQTIYITVWASPSISLHMGKIDTADELRKSHFGARLQPPIGQDRVAELGDWKKRDFKVCGTSWDVNSVDIAVSGAGWFSLGIKGEAKVALWTFAGVEVVQREPLVLDRAPFLERPGFWLPKAISDLIGEENKRKSEARKKREQIEDEEQLLEASV